MKKCIYREEIVIGESRLVYEVSGPKAAVSETPSTTAKPPEIARGKLDEVFSKPTGAHEHAEELLGEDFGLYDVHTEEGRQGLLERLAEAWDDTFDKLWGSIARIFGYPVDKAAIDNAVDSRSLEEETKEQEEDAKNPERMKLGEQREISKRSYRRAEEAAKKLLRDKEAKRVIGEKSWLDFIYESSATWDFPPGVLITFIEMESSWNPNSLPVYKDQNGNTVRSKLMPKNEAKARGLTLITSAHGLAQAMQKSVPKYGRDPEGYLRLRQQNPNLPETPNCYDSETAIDFMGWHLREIANGVTKIIENPGQSLSKSQIEYFGLHKGSVPENYKLNPSMPDYMKWLYMAYNNGALGYIVLRRYQESRSPDEKEANKNRLVWFQKREYQSKGKSYGLEGDVRAKYAGRVSEVAAAFEEIARRQEYKQELGIY